MTLNPYRPVVIVPLFGATRERTWRVELLDRDEQSLGFVGDSTDPKSGISAWQVTASDTTAALQAAGTIGLSNSLSSSSSLSSTVFRWVDLTVTKP